MQDAINKQINAEISSAYLYLSMSAYCAANNRPGCAHWMRVQWEEELSHAMRLFEHVNDRGGRAVLRAIPQRLRSSSPSSTSLSRSWITKKKSPR